MPPWRAAAAAFLLGMDPFFTQPCMFGELHNCPTSSVYAGLLVFVLGCPSSRSPHPQGSPPSQQDRDFLRGLHGADPHPAAGVPQRPLNSALTCARLCFVNRTLLVRAPTLP